MKEFCSILILDHLYLLKLPTKAAGSTSGTSFWCPITFLHFSSNLSMSISSHIMSMNMLPTSKATPTITDNCWTAKTVCCPRVAGYSSKTGADSAGLGPQEPVDWRGRKLKTKWILSQFYLTICFIHYFFWFYWLSKVKKEECQSWTSPRLFVCLLS